jgi:hypothetical protein
MDGSVHLTGKLEQQKGLNLVDGGGSGGRGACFSGDGGNDDDECIA